MRRADHSSRGILPNLVCFTVIKESHRRDYRGCRTKKNLIKEVKFLDGLFFTLRYKGGYLIECGTKV